MANDATGAIEQSIEAAAAELADMVLSLGPSIVNRPFGTGKMTDEEIKTDYLNLLANPAEIKVRLDKRVAQVGPNQAKAEMVAFVKKGQRLAGEEGASALPPAPDLSLPPELPTDLSLPPPPELPPSPIIPNGVI